MDAAADRAKRVDVQGDNVAAGVVAAQRIDGDGVGFGVAEPGCDHGAVAGVVVGERGDELMRIDAAFAGFGDDLDGQARPLQRGVGIERGDVEGVGMVGVVGRLISTRFGPVNRARPSM